MYDFETIPNRRNTDSIKWDIKPDELPMWIADMDFKTAPEITTAMQKKVSQGIFGYEAPGQDYFDAVADWYATEHHARPQTDWMIFTTGVVPAISAIVRRISHIGDNVVVQAPVYNIFYNSIRNNGRHILSNDLLYDEKTLTYAIDWDDLEHKLAEPLTTLMILCNPHNPIGKVWTKDELIRLATLCKDNHVTLLSDEIHGDLVLRGHDYTPLFSLPADLIQNIITLVSPSKTFNVAALHAATAIVPNSDLRASVNRGLNTDEVAEPNLLAIPGTIAAYTQGHDWLAALKQQLVANEKMVTDFVAANIPAIKVVPSAATYLMWLDCHNVSDNSEKLADFIRQKTGLYLNAGGEYGGDGHDFLRMNIACPASMVQDGLERLQKGIAAYQK
ncbi:cystathionine beta-lyase PatB [Lactobacillus selangorensis]|uniref:cysteine-S-conjugate beta-lyase n=1 Tax=Lactobacillus selangorensis TaxID=81857 RepID=A0A0R2FHP8_9LACO|nr:MalY/PatB family protein [Lactobacillus selangorensis]KRN28131.1 cystathionine beta-lyase PatB [Lactobacillus selangorensis]KRN30992.1 cystathionine beta-lyase PatB [Lactobacillus selangorensis]